MRLARAICHLALALSTAWLPHASAERDAVDLSMDVDQTGLSAMSRVYIHRAFPSEKVTLGELVQKLTAGKLWAIGRDRGDEKLPILEYLEARGLHLGMTASEIAYYRSHGRRPPPSLRTSVDYMQIHSGRAINVLYKMGIHTFADARRLTVEELRKQPDAGELTVARIVMAFEKAGFPIPRDSIEASRWAAWRLAPSPLDESVEESELPEPSKALIYSAFPRSFSAHRRSELRLEDVAKLEILNLLELNTYKNLAIEPIFAWLQTHGLRLGLSGRELAVYRETGHLPRPTRESTIDALGPMKTKSYLALSRLGIKLIEDAEGLTVKDFKNQKAIGDSTLNEIVSAFAAIGFPIEANLTETYTGPRRDLEDDAIDQIRKGLRKYDPSLILRGNVTFGGSAGHDAVIDHLWKNGIATLGHLVRAHRSGQLRGFEWIFLRPTLERLDFALSKDCTAVLDY